jgi:hypothetical protein
LSVSAHLFKLDGTDVPIDPVEGWVTFNQSPTIPGYDNVINTDEINPPNVTGTVLMYPTVPDINCRFKELMIYAGGGQIQGKSITVDKGISCYATAIFEETLFGWPELPTPGTIVVVDIMKPVPPDEPVKPVFYIVLHGLDDRLPVLEFLKKMIIPPRQMVHGPPPGPRFEKMNVAELGKINDSINTAVKYLTDYQANVKLLVDEKTKQTVPKKETP